MQNIILSFFTSVLVVIFAIPTIRVVAKNTGLYDVPDKRKLHTNFTPRLGGLGIFAGFTISFHLWGVFDGIGTFQYLVAALLILFFSGLKDDLVKLSPLKKLLGQVIAAVIVVLGEGYRLKSMYGIFGIYEIPYIASVLLTVFTIVVIINSFNLIDGIDGLAGGIGIITVATFGTWFYFVDLIGWSVLAFSLCGCLLGFLIFNFSPAKIFMGDAGSLTIGFLMAIFAIHFINHNYTLPADNYFFISTAPASAIAVLIIPLFDTLRVFTLRLMRKQSPFKADKNHIHHGMIDLGMTHSQVSLVMYAVNVMFVAIAFLLRYIKTIDLLLIITCLAFVISQIPAFLITHKLSNDQEFAARLSKENEDAGYVPLKKVP